MVSKYKLERKIEQLRIQMYQAYNQSEDQKEVLRISKELDTLLNQLNEFEQ